jgi:hypothetical protein
LNEHLFVANTMMSGLASNCTTLDPLNVLTADRSSARRFDRELRAAPALDADSDIQSSERNESHASSHIDGRGAGAGELPPGAAARGECLHGNELQTDARRDESFAYRLWLRALRSTRTC